MDFVALLSVFVMITITPVVARPKGDSENDATSIEGLSPVAENSEELVFKLPTTMKHGYTLTINGTINSTRSDIFTAMLRAENNGTCRITQDFKNNKLELSSDEGVIKVVDYDPDYSGLMKFSLFVRARKNEEDDQMFQLIFEANNAGESRIVTCKVNNMDDFGYIVFKGVENITSMLFKFNNYFDELSNEEQ